MEKYTEITYKIDRPLAQITLNRPDRANALSIQMIKELTHALKRADADQNVKVLVLSGAGKHFSAGHYLKEMIDGDVIRHQEVFNGCAKMMRLIQSIAPPVIARVRGVATAAGCQLAASCDLVVAEEGARFATPGVSLGLFCITPMVALTRAVGRKAAMEMLLTGRFVGAKEAKAMGLVNKVVVSDELEEQTNSLALNIAEASRLVLANGKRAFYAQVDQPDEKAYDYATIAMEFNLFSQDAQNGIRAFLNKTEPKWENR